VITIPLSTEDLMGMRFAFSPLCETILSFRVLLKPDEHVVHIPWATRASKALRGTNLRPLAMMYAEGHACPDFLSPPSTVSLASFEKELERFRETPSDLIRDDVEHFVYQVTEVISRRRLGPEQARALDGYLKSPRVSLHRLVETLLRYHDLVIAPYWPRMHALLEGDVLKRAHALAIGGAEALLSDLNPGVRYRGGCLELDRPYEAMVRPAGRGITLVPCVFAWPRVSVLLHPHWQPTLAYPPRGVANLWISSSPAPNGTALEAALSTGRASVLKGLLPAPRTTTELANQLGLSPAAISAHLSRLKAADLVEPHRNGKRVYYRLSFAGESLLEIFGETG
jgi:DNA-binding transcriptional ArsR family regulator